MAANSGFSIPACLGALRSSEHFKPPASTQISLDLHSSMFQLLFASITITIAHTWGLEFETNQ